MNTDLVQARYAAAVELERARNNVRVCARAGRVTLADRLRVTAAETSWDMQQIRQWRVTSCR